MITTSVGKLMQWSLRRFKGDGQALPGLIIERLRPGYLAAMLAQLPRGVVLVTGTNGKTTTAKMVTELLESQDLRVLTNPSGSNLTRGLISCVLDNATWRGDLPYDIAVFEIDEGYARQFVAQVRPSHVLALNVTRDQLDRFGEVDAVAKLLEVALRAATKGVVVNANDPYLVAIATAMPPFSGRVVNSFGVSRQLKASFPHDSALASIGSVSSTSSSAPRPARATPSITPDVLLTRFKDGYATYNIDGQTYDVRLQISGQHNYQNAAAALALARQILPQAPVGKYLQRLTRITEAFGRGELYTLPGGKRVQLVLVKNPAGFLQALASYVQPGRDIIIAINDNYADSRDVSWLWDVDFTPLKQQNVRITTGTRAADMALRLQYDGVETGAVEPSFDTALTQMSTLGKDVLIFATYTAMRELHVTLRRMAER